MNIDFTELIKFLTDTKLVSLEDIKKAQALAVEQNKTLSEVLISEGKLSEDDFRRVSAYLLGIPFVDLKNEKIDKDILFLIPEPIARKHNIVSFGKNERGLEVAMLDPQDLEAIEF